VKRAVGFSVFRPMSEDFDSTHHYADNEAVALMEGGHMHVLSEQTCVADKPVYIRTTSDGGSNLVLGKVRADSDYPAGGIVLTPTSQRAPPGDVFLGRPQRRHERRALLVPLGRERHGRRDLGRARRADRSVRKLRLHRHGHHLHHEQQRHRGDHRRPTRWSSRPPRAPFRVPGCFFDASRTGAGLVEIRRNKIN
jgi:hypothetical protein